MWVGGVGGRCAWGRPTSPALRASLRCSRQAGSAQTRFAQTCAALIRLPLRCSAVPQRPAPRTPPAAADRLGLHLQRACRRCAAIEPLEVHTAVRTPPEPGMRCGLGDPSAPSRSAAFRGSGPRMFERSEFARTPRNASTAEEPEGPAQWGRPARAAYRALPTWDATHAAPSATKP